MPRIARIRTHVLEAPLSEPFAWSFMETSTRGACLVEVTTEDGLSGWGECFGPARLNAPIVAAYGRMLVGQASLSNLSGPLTIADFAGQSVERGWSHYLAFLALVSVSLGVLNLLPLPMLDGGHLMYYLFEAVSGRAVPDAWLERLQRGGVALLFLMMSLALVNDFSRLLGLH